jgi:intracellular septation protein A
VQLPLFGGMGLMFAFVIAQAFWMAKYLPDEEAKPAPGAAPETPKP